MEESRNFFHSYLEMWLTEVELRCSASVVNKTAYT